MYLAVNVICLTSVFCHSPVHWYIEDLTRPYYTLIALHVSELGELLKIRIFKINLETAVTKDGYWVIQNTKTLQAFYHDAKHRVLKHLVKGHSS